VKRIFDIIVSLVGMIFLLPLYVIIPISMLIYEKDFSILFRQTRVGQYGNPFVILKFRTMHPDSSDDSISVAGQERITKIGSILRRYKLDELPELWNVFRGDMSFVGPRPDVPGYADSLKDEDRNILKLRPGITGPATLKYANEEEILRGKTDPKKYNDEVIYPDKVKLNVEYYRTNSLFLDIEIMLKSIFRSYHAN
jgi:lipopolysaccharide/colanic/teichoic acid biosynthesis glycosyltransferase